MCKTLADDDGICRRAVDVGLLCAVARSKPMSLPKLAMLLKTLEPAGAPPLDREFRRGPRFEACALAWALEAGNDVAANMISAARHALAPYRFKGWPIGSARDLLTWYLDATGVNELAEHDDTFTEGDELAWAALGGLVGRCETLLAAGLSPSSNDAAALHWSCERGHEDVVRLLLKDTSLSDRSCSRVGHTAVSEALLTACAGGHSGVVRLLLTDPRCSLDVRLPFSCMLHWTTPLPSDRAFDDTVRFESYPESYRWDWDDEVVRRLCDLLKASPELCGGCFSFCALSVAARVGNAAVVSALLEHQQARSTNGVFAVVLALLSGYVELADSLLDFFYCSARRSRAPHVLDFHLHRLVFLAACMGGSRAFLHRVTSELAYELDIRWPVDGLGGWRSLGRAGVGLAAKYGNVELMPYLLSVAEVFDECADFAPGQTGLDAFKRKGSGWDATVLHDMAECHWHGRVVHEGRTLSAVSRVCLHSDPAENRREFGEVLPLPPLPPDHGWV